MQNIVGRVLLTLRYHLIKNRLTVDLIQVKDIAERQNCGRSFYLIYFNEHLLIC